MARPAPCVGRIAIVICSLVIPTTVPGADVGAPAPEAANQEVLRVREVGADEADLYLDGGPEAAPDAIWRVFSRSRCVEGEEGLTGEVLRVYLVEGDETEHAGYADTVRVRQSGREEARKGRAV